MATGICKKRTYAGYNHSTNLFCHVILYVSQFCHVMYHSIYYQFCKYVFHETV